MLENGRAKAAYDAVQNVGNIDEYSSHVKQMPMLIKTNGLAQALLFAKSKDNKRAIYNHINEWLLLKRNRELFNISNDVNDIMAFIVKTDSRTYRFITTETMTYLEWLKRFAEGRKKGEKNG